MTATPLDGKATLATIKAELAVTGRRPARAGGHPGPRHRAGRRRPGQPVVRRRQAPRLRRDRHRQHRARAARHGHPGRGRGGRRRAQRRPGLHRLPGPAAAPGSTSSRSSPGSTRSRTSTGCTRPTWARWCSGEPAPLPCTPTGIVELLRRYDVPIAGAEVVHHRPRHHRRPPARAAADPAQRERHGHPVPHRHPGPGRARAPGRHRRGRRRRARHDHRRHGQARRRGARRRGEPGRGRDGRSRIAGDVAADVAEVAGWLTPNPGGVGPMTRAMLLVNVVEAAERALARR